MEQQLVLSAGSGLFFTGEASSSPWHEDPEMAKRFSCGSAAWKAAKALMDTRGEFLEGDPVYLEALDRESGEALRIAQANTPYALLRSSWRRVLGEPLPLDMPDAPDSPEVARWRLLDFLHDTNWDAVRSRGDDSLRFDPAFRAAADMLRQADPEGFLNLWASVVPPDIPPALSCVREPNEVASPDSPTSQGDGKAASADLPSYVARHFAGSRGSFYYRQRPDVLAFSIRGESFRAADDSVVTATAIVEIARARGWSRLRVRGSAAFRRAVWAAASERGLAVKGYSPTRGEVAVLAQSSAPDGRLSDGSREQASTRSPDPSLSGAVVAMGEAPYRHDASNSASFFVTLRASDGTEHTHWGVGLKQAMEQASVSPGDRISMQRFGKQQVEVDRPVLDAMGDVSFSKHAVVERRVWTVAVLKRSADSLRPAAEGPKRAGVVGDPAFAKALALVEKRMPQMSDSDRAELIRHFNVAHERLSKNHKRDSPVKALSSRSVSRSARR